MPLTVDGIRMRHAEGFYCASECAPAIAFLLLEDRKLFDALAAKDAEIAAISKKCTKLEDDRDYNAELCEKKDAEIAKLKAAVEWAAENVDEYIAWDDGAGGDYSFERHGSLKVTITKEG